MRLSDLSPRFVGAGGEGVYRADGSPAPERAGVGIMLSCPCGCASDLYVPFDKPLDGGPPLDSDSRHVWQRQGETFENLTLSPSILRIGGCGWHGWIRNGEIINA